MKGSSEVEELFVPACSSSSYGSTCENENGGSNNHDHHDGEEEWKSRRRNNKWRRAAISLSLYLNLSILATKAVTFVSTNSLSVLAALVDSVLDVVSQLVLCYAADRSSRNRTNSAILYPAGASRMEPVGVLTCAALMGMASFVVLKDSILSLCYDPRTLDGDLTSFWSMFAVVVVKVALLLLCRHVATSGSRDTATTTTITTQFKLPDSTLEALAQDHANDALSNAVAAIALLLALRFPHLWILDPTGAIVISIYIIYSWYKTGKTQIEQLIGKSAPQEFVQQLIDIAIRLDNRVVVDVCRAYHFGPKYLVEIEVILPRETPLSESHDIGMELQYEIEGLEEVERCFVHMDYESRPYDEHLVSKVPELREKYRPSSATTITFERTHSV